MKRESGRLRADAGKPPLQAEKSGVPGTAPGARQDGSPWLTGHRPCARSLIAATPLEDALSAIRADFLPISLPLAEPADSSCPKLASVQ